MSLFIPDKSRTRLKLLAGLTGIEFIDLHLLIPGFFKTKPELKTSGCPIFYGRILIFFDSSVFIGGYPYYFSEPA
jgi:hypothetical protein